jgi:hypothetical protein
MFKASLFILAVTLLVPPCASAQGGFLSTLRERALPGPNQARPNESAGTEGGAASRPAADAHTRGAGCDEKESRDRGTQDRSSDELGMPSPGISSAATRGAGKAIFGFTRRVGRKKQSQKVVVEYTPQSNGTLLMETRSFDLVSKQWVVQESAVYSVNGDTVTITVTRPDGSKQTQTGHYSDDQLFVRVEHQRRSGALSRARAGQ